MSTTAQQDDQSNQGTEDENKLPSSVHDLQIVTQDLQKSCDNRSNANVENKTSGNSVLIKEDPMHTDLDDYKIIEKSSMTPQNYQLNQVKEEENKLQIDNKAAGDCILSKNLTPTDFDVPKVNVVRYTDDNLVINPEHLAKSQSVEEIADSLTEKEEEILLNVDEENLMFANKFTKPVENANDKLITDIDKPINESVKTSNKNDDKASSSITSVDVDGYSSEILEEDMILKWDDNSEVEEPSSSDSNTDHKKNKEPSSSNQEQGHVDTIEQHEDICPTDTTNSSDKTKLGIQIIDNDQAVESSTLTVDNVIAKLEDIIEDDEALSIGNENTKEIESSIKDFETLPVHVELSDNQMNLDSSEVNIEECLTNIDKQIENIDHIEIKSKTVPVQTELNDNQMDLDAYEVNIEECLNNIDKQIEDIDQIEKKSKMIDKNITFDTSIVTETSASSNENNESINSLQINANSTILDHDISIGKNDSLEMNKNLRPLEIDGIETETNNDINTEISTSDIDSSLDVSIQLKEHNLNKPNMMIEIPSQELIDFVDDSDLSNNDNSMAENVEKGKNMEKSNKTLTEVTDNSNPPCNNVEKNNQDLTTTKMNLMKTSKREEVESEPDKVDKQSKEQRTKTHVREEVIKDISEQSTNLLSKDGVEDSEVTNTKHLTSTSALMAPDTSDEVPEVTDSLGLLAESSRVIEDDEEQETSEHDYGDDEEDFDPDDESSNQMTAEQSEDSNAQHSETDAPKDKPVTQANIQSDSDNAQDFTDKQVESSAEEKPEFTFALSDVVSLSVGKDADNKVAEAEKDGIIDIEDEIVCEEDDLAPETISDKELDNNQMEQTIKSTDTPVAPTVEDKNVNDEKKEQAGEIEIVKLSDTSDNEDGATAGKEEKENMLRYLLLKSTQTKKDHVLETERQSPSKSKNLETSEQNSFVNLVDLEESSSEDEVDQRKDDTSNKDPAVDVDRSTSTDVTSVNIPKEIEIMSSGENTSEIVTKEGEVVISGLPKPSPHKRVRLNTSEVSIKPAGAIESTIFIPETKINDDSQEKPKPKLSLEVFSLDSDDEDSIPVTSSTPMAPELEKTWINRCINDLCRSDNTIPHHVADRATVAFYDPNRKRKAMVCETCEDVVARRAQSLIDGIKNFTPLLEMDLGKICEDLVEISDSESDEDPDDTPVDKEALIGVEGAKVLEEKLADMINDTWVKYKMDLRLQATQDEVNSELDRMERESQEIDQMLDDCQIVTDRLRNELYATFETQVEELPPITICEMSEVITTRQSKRRLSSANETVAKRPAIPLGYTSLDAEPSPSVNTQQPKADPKPVVTADSSKLDDDKDISVVTTSAETVPADLPPPGEAMRPPLRVGMQVYAMRNAFGSWLRAKVVECTPKSTASPFSVCRVKFENKPNIKTAFKTLPGRSLAYHEPSEVRMNIGARIIALFKDSLNQTKRESYYSGVVAEPPSPLNGYRYLVFFDDGYAQYVQHRDTRLVCEFSSLVWEEVHPFSREFVRKYLTTFPERPMVKLHTGQSLKTEWNGKWWISKAMKVDASLVQVHFEEDNRTEWIYRGSTRLAPLYLELQAAERHRARPLPRNRVLNKVNMPYVEYTRDESSGKGPLPHPQQAVQTQAQAQEELRRQRAVAKKSTGAAPPPPAPAPAAPPAVPDTITSRVVYYTPKNSVKPYKMVNHTCGPKCKRSDVLALRDLRTYNPLAKPLLSGWERQVVRHKGHKEVMYRAPCGRRLRGLAELHRYLRATHSDMGVDLFDFGASTHCLAEFVLNRCIVSKKDLSHGKENVPVPCVNYYDEALPEFCSYNTERTPTEGVPLNLDPEFLCGCDCTDDCEDKSKCACWQMTLEGARTIGMGPNVGYSYKRLPEPLPSGIYECNSRCKCKHTCLNRVAQHPLQLKLQVFKTLNRGWGIRALNDVPKGSFLCVYAGNLLTDATANLDGLNEGDEYLAELDYIEVVEQMKEGYEEDIPQHDKKLDKKDSGNADEDDEESTTSEEDETPSKDETNDGDFEPGFIGFGITEFNKRLRKRAREKMEKDAANVEKNKDAGKENSDDCITISDDEEVREPSRFMAQAGIGANEFVSKYRSVRSHFGKDEACYIMDAKVQGNIGRYLNHSCSPNVFVQNVFVDTHDPRFPWVAFFALWHIKAGTELTWNYNYDIGSVPGKVLYCYCGAPNCRGRLL